MMMCKKGGLCVHGKIAHVLLVVGGLNWGLVGAFEYNVVDALLGSGSLLARVVFVAVGLAAIAALVGCRCKACQSGKV